MTSLSRRSFARLMATSFPVILSSKGVRSSINQTTNDLSGLQTISGHPLSEEERALAAKFLASQEKNLSPLRISDLPNGLPPTFSHPAPTDDLREGRTAR